MVRSLWTAASGMNAQQTSLDTIAHNLANVNTVGYKSEQAQFKSLLYQDLQINSTTADGAPKLGVRCSAIASQFKQGNFDATDGDFDFAIEGDGFFNIQRPDGTISYTRSGNFNVAIGANGNWQLATADGLQVIGIDGNPIEFPADYDMTELSFSEWGEILYNDEVINQFQLTQFNNPAGLEKQSGTLFKATEASREARQENSDAALQRSRVINGRLEASNVNVATEMVNMIITQRAYELNSKAIIATDSMLQQANNLRS